MATGRLLARIDRLRPPPAVVVTSDHGEEFGEHGGRFHAQTLYEEVLRIPLLVRVPGVTPPTGASRPAPVSLIDLHPPLLDLAGLGVPEGLDGVSLVPWLRAAPPPASPASPASPDTPDRTIVADFLPDLVGDHPYTATLRGHDKRIDDPVDGVTERYDLATDPGEQRNLASAP